MEQEGVLMLCVVKHMMTDGVRRWASFCSSDNISGKASYAEGQMAQKTALSSCWAHGTT